MDFSRYFKPLCTPFPPVGSVTYALVAMGPVMATGLMPRGEKYRVGRFMVSQGALNRDRDRHRC